MASSDSSEDEDFAAIKKRRKTESPYVEKSDAVASGEKSRRLVSEESVEEFIEEDDQTEIDPVRKDSTEVGSDTDNEKNPDNVSKLSLSEQDSFDEELFGLALSPEYKQSQQEKALGTRFKALTRNMTPDSKDDEESLVSSSQEVVDQLKHIQEKSSVSSSQEQNGKCMTQLALLFVYCILSSACVALKLSGNALSNM